MTSDIVHLAEIANADRRQHRRYPLHLDGEYWVRNKTGDQKRGFGRTVDISSGGVLFEANDSSPLSGEVELLLEWPAVLDHIYPLRLRIRGTVVRNEGRIIAIDMRHYTFRTANALLRPRDRSPRKINSDLRAKKGKRVGRET